MNAPQLDFVRFSSGPNPEYRVLGDMIESLVHRQDEATAQVTFTAVADGERRMLGLVRDSDARVREGGTAVFRLLLTGLPFTADTPVEARTFDIVVADGGATAADLVDPDRFPERIVLEPGERDRRVEIEIRDDDATEPLETLTLRIADAPDSVEVGTRQASRQITGEKPQVLEAEKDA